VAGINAGQIVGADWRDTLPKEPSELRPAFVVEDEGLFDPAYPSLILVPLTEDARLAIADLLLVIEPSPGNGCAERCRVLSPCVATTSAKRLRATRSTITPDQLRTVRRQIGLAMGLA
jgi:mRNA interferase MazF